MHYHAYIDETFREFFSLPKEEGFMAYGIALIPEDKIESFNNLFERYLQSLSEKLGLKDKLEKHGELKSKFLRTMSDVDRREALNPLLVWLASHGCFVGGVYTTTQGYLNYMLRTIKHGEHLVSNGKFDEIEVKQARDDILHGRRTSIAESFIISDFALLLLSMISHFCGHRAFTVDAYLDPREGAEEKAVISKTMSGLKGMEKFFFGTKVLQNVYADTASKESFGLQFADHLARDVSALFRSFPAFLHEYSSPNEVTNRVNDMSNLATELNGKTFKSGDTNRISKKGSSLKRVGKNGHRCIIST